jgi:hypothetical protein
MCPFTPCVVRGQDFNAATLDRRRLRAAVEGRADQPPLALGPPAQAADVPNRAQRAQAPAIVRRGGDQILAHYLVGGPELLRAGRAVERGVLGAARADEACARDEQTRDNPHGFMEGVWFAPTIGA